MLGGGFLKQAQDTFIRNRELKNNALKGSLERKDFTRKRGESLSKDDPKLSESQRIAIIAKMKREINRERLLTIVLSVIILVVLILFFMNLEKPYWL